LVHFSAACEVVPFPKPARIEISQQPAAPKQAAEEVDSRRPAPKGAFDFERLAVSLKRYPDTRLEFFRSL
jgi:hypothetical protein